MGVLWARPLVPGSRTEAGGCLDAGGWPVGVVAQFSSCSSGDEPRECYRICIHVQESLGPSRNMESSFMHPLDTSQISTSWNVQVVCSLLQSTNS